MYNRAEAVTVKKTDIYVFKLCNQFYAMINLK